MLWLADLLESQPPTGEPSARNWPARFGGRGDLIRRPYPYRRRRSGSVLSFQGEFPYIELHVMLESDANSPGWNAYASKGIADVSR